MRSFLALMFYIDYKCSTQPGFRKTLLVLMLIFVFLVWSPWRPLLCPVFRVCPTHELARGSDPLYQMQGGKLGSRCICAHGGSPLLSKSGAPCTFRYIYHASAN